MSHFQFTNAIFATVSEMLHLLYAEGIDGKGCNMQALSEDLLDGAAAAAAYTGLKPRTIYRMAETNEIPVIRKGGKLFFRKSALDAAFASDATNVRAEA